MKKKYLIKLKSFSIFIMALSLLGCSKWLEVPAPSNEIDASDVFRDSSTANAAVIGIYSYMHNYNYIQESAFRDVVSNIGGRLSDEFSIYQSSSIDEFGRNSIFPENETVLNLWSDLYQTIYFCNSLLERIENSNNISKKFSDQLRGEALFIRSFCYFYLANYFGDVPLITNINVELNSKMGRSDKKDVYAKIVDDLERAKILLSDNYDYIDSSRGRATKWAASFLLSRIYLYSSNFEKAESEATEVISRMDLFSLPTTKNAFLATSGEAIWRFTSNNGRTHIQDVFSPNQQTNNPRVILTASLLNCFENGDTRFLNWIGKTRATDGKEYYYPSKYKFTTESNVIGDEADIVLRLGELYLIRAESRLRKSNIDISGAISDVDKIRDRANLKSDFSGFSPSKLLAIIEKERRTELFAEYSHRWFDLIRTQKAEEVLGQDKPETWKSTAILLPIPQNARNSNINLSQNEGYPQ